MNTNEDRHEPLDLSQYEANRSKFPPDELAKYWGKQVAFSPDGRRIVASGDTGEELDAALDAAGIPSDRVVYSYIDPPDESWI